MKISELIPDKSNANKGTDKGREMLEISLQKYGAGRSILIDKAGRIIAGNKTVEQAENLNMDDVIVVPSDGSKIVAVQRTDLDLEKDKKARELAYADNRIAEIDLKWDYDQILKDAEVLPIEEWFSKEELEELKGEQVETEVIPEEELNNVPEVKKEAISKLGDLFLIDGKHRVLCGDSTKEEDVSLLMDGKKAELCVTDPPYGVSYADKNKYLNTISRGNHIQTEIKNDHIDINDLADDVIYPVFCNIKEVLADYSSYYITAPQGGDLLMMMMMMQKAGLILRHMIIWAKNNHVLGRSDYNYKHEPILFGWVHHHKFYGEGKHKFSLWEIDKPLKNDLHSTMKPVELVENAILNSSLKDNIILDLFLGSGTTLIACEQTGRICHGMEIEPLYIDVILRRYHKLYPDKTIQCLNREFPFEVLFNA